MLFHYVHRQLLIQGEWRELARDSTGTEDEILIR
jgi:hypothetical protein